MTSAKKWWVASIEKFQNADSCNNTDASTYIGFAVTKRTNTPTLHTANNAIRLCREHTDDKLKLSFKGTGRGPPHVGFDTFRRREGGTRGGWVCLNAHSTSSTIQHDVLTPHFTTNIIHFWRLYTVYNRQCPIL